MLLQHSVSNSEPDMSFDISASPEYVSGIRRASLAKTKVLAKAEASKKRRASTSGSALSQVAKRTRSVIANFSRSSVRPNLFNDDSDNEETNDDPDACVEILLVTLIRSRGNAIMDDAVDTPSRSTSHSRAFTGPTPATRDPTGDAIDKDSFPFSSDSRLRSLQQKLASLHGLDSRVSNLKKQVLDLNDKVTASDVSFANSKAKGKDQKKKIKSLSKSLDQLTAEAARLAFDLNQAQSDFQSLVRRFLASDEFSRAQGEIFSLATSVGFERRLNIDRTQEQLAATLKKISHFMPRAQADEDMFDAASGKPVEVLMWGVVLRGARGMPENFVRCSKLEGRLTVDVRLSI
ncbi:hypothetical protein Tco_0065695 [Tanacetum coccineum]